MVECFYGLGTVQVLAPIAHNIQSGLCPLVTVSATKASLSLGVVLYILAATFTKIRGLINVAPVFTLHLCHVKGKVQSHVYCMLHCKQRDCKL